VREPQENGVMQPLRAICFDLDNTFWDVVPVIVRAEQVLHDWLATHCPGALAGDDVAALRRDREAVARAHPHLQHDVSFLRQEALRRRLVAAGHPAEMALRAFEVFFAARNRVDLFVDVAPALERLATRYRLMTLTNGNADLVRIGIAHHFECSLTAADAGCAKPDARIFAAMLERAGLQPHEVLYVGDEPEVDIVGARRAGLPAAWINRRQQPWPVALPEPDWSVPDLAQLADRLLEADSP
jgi:putative hydrolase of the HAD superfamily